MYPNGVYSRNEQVEVPKLQLENLGGGPSSKSLSRNSANTSGSSKAKRRQRFGGMARAYSEQVLSGSLRGVDALYWNDISDEEAGRASKAGSEEGRLQSSSSKSLGKRSVQNRHRKQPNLALSRAQSVEPEILRNSGGLGSQSLGMGDVRSHGVAAPAAERANSLPWHAIDGWGGNRDVHHYGVDASDMRLWSGAPVNPSASPFDAAVAAEQRRPRTPLDIPRLPRTNSSRERLASLEGWSIDGLSSLSHGMHRPPDSVHLDRQWSQNSRHMRQSASLKDLNRLREVDLVENVDSGSVSRSQSLRTAYSLQTAASMGKLEREPWEMLPEEATNPNSSGLQGIKHASNVDLGVHLNQQKNFIRTESFPDFFGGKRLKNYKNDDGDPNEADFKGGDAAIPTANLDNDTTLRQLHSAGGVTLARMGNSSAHHIVSPFAQLATGDQDVVPKSSHPSPPPVPHEDLERKRNHLSPHLDLESRLPEKENPSSASPPKSEQKGVRWWLLVLHYFTLLFAEFPIRSHRRWLRKMYRENRLAKPADYNDPQGTDSELLDSIGSLISPHPKTGRKWRYSSDEEYMRARYNHTKSIQGTQNMRRMGKQREAKRGNQDALVEVELGRLPKRSPRPGSLSPQINLSGMNANQAELPSPSQPSGSRHFVMRSLDRVGDIITSLTPRNHRPSFSRMSMFSGNRAAGGAAPELISSGAWNRRNRIQLRRRKGRLARIWDHIRHPLTSMRKKYKKSPYKAQLIAAIGKRTSHKYDGFWDRVQTELLIWGQWAYELMSPPKFNSSFLLFTTFFPFLLLSVFFYMAGEYPSFLREAGESHGLGPHEMKEWIIKSNKWRTFNSAFLAEWGARFLPYVPNQPQRWFSAIFIHENFGHLANNALLFIILSWGLESKYGPWRTVLVCFMSGVTGNFVSAVWEDPCALVLGASGCVFGLAAFYILDIVVDFRNVVFPFLRLFGVAVFLSATAASFATQKGASHLSHLGGFLAGAGFSFIFTPRFFNERIEAAVPWMLLLTVLISFVAIPIYVYESVLPNLVCAEI